MKTVYRCCLSLLLLGYALPGHAQVGIGTPTPDGKAALEIRAADKGLLIPRLTAAQRTAITAPPQGLMVYQTDGSVGGGAQTGFWYYAGTGGWVFIEPARTDNLGNHTATQNLNLTDKLLVGGTAATPGTQGLKVDASGRVGIGLGTGVAPTEQLHVDGGNAKIGLDRWSTAADDRLLKFGDGSYATMGETGGDDLLQFLARDFRFNPSPVGSYSGNVGIGLGAATAASERLEVGGNVKITGPSGTTGLVFPDGTKQVTAAPSGELVLPYSGAAGPGGAPVFSINNTSTGPGLRGLSASGSGVLGRVNGTGAGQGVVGIKGTTVPNVEDAGVVGLSEADYGVYGRASQQSGVVGITDGAGSGVAGVQGVGNGSSTGVWGTSTSGSAVRGSSSGTGRAGYFIQSNASSQANAVEIANASTGRALYVGQTNANTFFNALEVQSSSQGRTAYFSQNNASNSSTALEVQNAGTGSTALFNQQGNGNAVRILNNSFGPNMPALLIEHNNPSSAATSIRSSASGVGLELVSPPVTGQTGYPVNSIRFRRTTDTQPVAFVQARYSFPAGYPAPAGELDFSCLDASGYANSMLRLSGRGEHYLEGRLNIQGSAYVNSRLDVAGDFTVSGNKAFRIDHPLDPENKYLYHSCVESPDMMNIYNGNATLDAQGEADVELPTYFEALNQDFRYQLTALGAPGPNLYVAAEVRNHHFRIAGGKPGSRVSWQVTGIRHDRAAGAHPLVPEVSKEPENRGKYLRPDAYGLPAARGIGYRPAKAPPKAAE